MRARNIKPGFYKNEELAECSIWARFIFPGLWQMADRKGRLEDRPKKIKGELLPYDTQAIEPLLQELHERKFILRYELNGARYIQILKFKKHQSPHFKEAPSTLPPPPQSLWQEGDGTGSEPEASDLFNEQKPEALPPSEGGRTALNPDSGFRTSDSLNPEPGKEPTALSPSGSNGGNCAAEQDPVVERIPLVGKQGEFEVRKSLRDELDRLYPGVDPDQTLREIRGWCIGNPTKCKTRRGVGGFITRWFGKEQDKESRRPG